jgi:hypothetical protein
LTVFAEWPHLDAVNLAPAMIVAGFGQGLMMSPLFGVVLAGVPAARAGVGSGILVTTQQTSLALGVAALGSLFVSLAAPTSLGMRGAFAVVLAIQIAVALAVAVGATMLPVPARQTREPQPAPLEPVAELAA